ncbi:MAG: MFS transporter [Chloroflexi bacterium]|nr:MFS transporter [Chloroflexota bacterium]
MSASTIQASINQTRFMVSVGLGLFATMSTSLMLAPLLVAMAADFDTSVSVAGQLNTVTFAAWGFSVVSVGPLSDSFGRRPVALIGLTLLAVSVLASAFAPNIGTLMALRVISGLGGGMMPPNSMAAVADSLPPERRARAIGTLMAFTALSGVIGVPLVAVVADAGGWRVPFLVIGSMLAACAVLNWFWFPRGASAREGGGLQSFSFFSRYKALLAIPMFRALLVANFAQRIAFMALFSYLATYLIDSYDTSVGAVAVPLAFVGIGTVAGSYAGGIVANRNDRMPLIAMSAIAGGVAASLLFALDLPLWLAAALATVSISLFTVPFTVLLAVSTQVSSQSRATGVGLFGISNQAGMVGGAALGGILLASSGFSGIGYLCLGVTAFSVVVIILFMREPARSL